VLESATVEVADGGDDVVLGGRRRRRMEPIVIGGLALAVVGGAVLVGGGGSQGAPPPTPSTTTNAPPSTSTTSTTVERDRFDVVTLGPLLAEPTATVVYGLSRDAEIVRVDVDRGEVATRRLRGARGERPDGYSVLARSGAAFLAQPGGRGGLFVRDGAGGPVRWVSAEGSRFVPAANTSALWRVADGDEPAVALVGLDGSLLEPEVPLPASVSVIGDDGTGALLLDGPGGTYRLAADGPQRLTAEPLVAWSATTLVTTACDERLACAWRTTDRVTGQSALVPVAGDLRPAVAGSVSPDGRHVAVVANRPATSLDVVDLSAGERTTLARTLTDTWGFGYGASAAWWSPTGSHLFFLDGDGRLQVWSAATRVAEAVPGVPVLRSLSVTGAG